MSTEFVDGDHGGPIFRYHIPECKCEGFCLFLQMLTLIYLHMGGGEGTVELLLGAMVVVDVWLMYIRWPLLKVCTDHDNRELHRVQ